MSVNAMYLMILIREYDGSGEARAELTHMVRCVFDNDYFL